MVPDPKTLSSTMVHEDRHIYSHKYNTFHTKMGFICILMHCGFLNKGGGGGGGVNSLILEPYFLTGS